MPKGFFKKDALPAMRQVEYAIPRCGACGLFRNCHSPKMEVSGKGRKKILIIGEAPGADEDEKGIPFIGKSGQRLESELLKHDISLRRDCWITNSLICRPPENATPTEKQLACCRPNYTKTIRELQPEIIIPLGKSALQQVLKGLWMGDLGEIGRWVGWQIPNREPNAWICPTWHPAFLGYQSSPVLDLWWSRHLKRACRLSGRPWVTVPDYKSQVRVILDPDEAAQTIRTQMLLGDLPAAFDYETNMLKPDGADARIFSCSICWEGVKTIAYPWVGKAIEATGEFLRSKAPKIMANAKFEIRWSMSKLGIFPKNVWWDTMQAAHILDNRPGITGLKFQGFVKLGMPSYNKDIEPYFESEGPSRPNRIKEADLHQVLLYNALDSLLEWKLMELQRKELGYAGLHSTGTQN